LKRLMGYGLALGWLLAIPASASLLYSNGALNGQGDAWGIDSYEVSDSFTVSSGATITAFNFVGWTDVGQLITTVNWSIGTSPDGTNIASGTGAAVTASYDSTATYGSGTYDINTYTVTGLSAALAGAGTYWLTLTGAVASDAASGGRPFWDENDGPSAAYDDSTSLVNGGSIAACANGNSTCTGSETFNIFGNPTNGNFGGTLPEPGGMGLAGCGLLALAGALRRKMR